MQNAPNLNRYDLFLSLVLFLLALLPRFFGLAEFSTVDEGRWLNCSVQYLHAVEQADWQGTRCGPGHPAVTTQQLGALGILGLRMYNGMPTNSDADLSPDYYPYAGPITLNLLAWARFPIVLLASLFVVVAYLVFRASLDRSVALLTALMLCFDPFFVAMSRSVLTDGPHAIFAVISILLFGLGLRHDKWYWAALSGASAGLAFLSKAPAFFALGFTVLIVTALAFALKVETQRGWQVALRRLVIWYGALAASVFIFWPSMWVQPLASLKFVFDNLFFVAIGGYYQSPEGPLFYLGAILLRATPFALIGALVSLWLMLSWFLRFHKRPIRHEVLWLLLFWMACGTYVGMFSLGVYKNDFYITPAHLLVIILGAMGLTYAFKAASNWLAQFVMNQRTWRVFGVSVVLVTQILLCIDHYPYYFTYFNPTLGGAPVALRLIPTAVRHGEGLDQVVEYLNSRENSEDLYVGMNVIGIFSNIELEAIKGHLLAFPNKRTQDIDRHWLQFDYVGYYNGFGRYSPSQDFARNIDWDSPEFVAKIKGIDYISLYRIPQERFLSLPPDAKAKHISYENGLVFEGYRLGDVIQNRSTGMQQVPVTLYWQSQNYCQEDYCVVLKLRNSAYKIWGDKAVYPICSGHEIRWRDDLVLPDEHKLELLPGTPPGSYSLEMWVLRRLDGEQVDADADWDHVLGVIEAPLNTMISAQSLDMEHQIRAKFSDKIVLLGYNVSGGARQGETLYLTLFWQAIEKPEDNYKVFVHVVDAQGRLLNQKDSDPVDGFYPTRLWQAGQIIRDQYMIVFSDDSGLAAAGLRIGLYSPLTGERLPLTLANGDAPVDRAVHIP